MHYELVVTWLHRPVAASKKKIKTLSFTHYGEACAHANEYSKLDGVKHVYITNVLESQEAIWSKGVRR